MRSSLNSIVAKTLFIISNITGGNAAQIQAVIGEGLFEDIFEVCRGGEYRSQTETHRAIFNVELNGTEEQISCVMGSVGMMRYFCDRMKLRDPHVILDGVKDWFAT